MSNKSSLHTFKPKVLIAVPSGGSQKTVFTTYLMNLLLRERSRGLDVDLTQNIVPYIDWNRIALAEYAYKNKYSHMLFLDNDMVFPLDILERLLAHDVDVVTTNYVTKGIPARFMALGEDGEQVVTGGDSTGLEEVMLAPTGTMLIRVDVFRKIEKPWFGTNREKGIGEDYWFCVRCRERGIKVYVDHDLTKEVGHVGDYTYTWKDVYRTDSYRMPNDLVVHSDLPKIKGGGDE